MVFRWGFVFLTIALVSALICAQETTVSLTNADVIKLLRSGLSQHKVAEIVTRLPGVYDTSAAAVATLKKDGATDVVISAIVDKQEKKSLGKRQPEAAIAAEGGRHLQFASTPAAESVEPEACGEESFDNTLDCHNAHKTGCSHSDNPKYDAYLNLLKNRLTFSDEPQFMQLGKLDELEHELPETLTSRNHAAHASELEALGEGQTFTVIGTLYYAMATDAETCNCQMSGAEDVVDFHIGIGSDAFPLSQNELNQLRSGRIRSSKQLSKSLGEEPAHSLEEKAYIVEMTPHYRAGHPGEEWTLDRLLHSVGEKVRVTGQLMVDNDHFVRKDDCGIGENDTCWRKSVWELHPVTRFEVCTGTTCSEASADWIPLNQVK